MSDPEEWVNLEENEKESWEFELRVSHFNPIPQSFFCLSDELHISSHAANVF
jgi:hypothetical protein